MRPILVTGAPRSGTTWVARELARGRGAALTGREPMNPHRGQYRLGGTIERWSRITTPTPAQRRHLRWAYRGLMPLTYSRYGVRQWSAPLPWTRLIVKDPFALLSIPMVAEVTGAVTVVLYRHPGAVLASYRRMGWRPDMAEVAPLVTLEPPSPSDGRADGVVGEMARFWTALYRTVLDDVADRPDVFIVSHEEMTRGGLTAQVVLAGQCGLDLNARSAAQADVKRRMDPTHGAVAREPEIVTPETAPARRLHNFDRNPEEVAQRWRAEVTALEVEILEHHARNTLDALHRRRLVLDDEREAT